MRQGHDVSVVIFLLALGATFLASYLGRRHAKKLASDVLSAQRLNKWLVGLSAGATGNSAFIVTGAVGLGYSLGVQSLLLPFAWLIGDIVFWAIFPAKINRVGREAKAATLADVIASPLPPSARRAIKLLTAILVLICLAGYLAGQWLAGEKFLEGAFRFPSFVSLVLFATLIVFYTAIGGFRGSVYADTLQAIIRIVGTAVALAAVILVADWHNDAFQQNIGGAGPDFLKLFPKGLAAAVAYVIGFAAAALGFELGQPQLITRYLAGESPAETRSAWWIFIGFVQFTWVCMTIFGIILRGVMPALPDPEAGLSIFFRTDVGPILTGIIVADIFATIAATSNSLLVVMAQTAKFDLLESLLASARVLPLWPIVAVLGVVSMAISAVLNRSVAGLVLSSISLLGAGLAPAMMIRVLGWRHTGPSLVLSIISGFAVAAIWKFFGAVTVINEAVPGILTGLSVNFIIWAAHRRGAGIA